jgi:hypothetical protein
VFWFLLFGGNSLFGKLAICSNFVRGLMGLSIIDKYRPVVRIFEETLVYCIPLVLFFSLFCIAFFDSNSLENILVSYDFYMLVFMVSCCFVASVFISKIAVFEMNKRIQGSYVEIEYKEKARSLLEIEAILSLKNPKNKDAYLHGCLEVQYADQEVSEGVEQLILNLEKFRKENLDLSNEITRKMIEQEKLIKK